MSILQFKKVNCKDCYKCVRYCPVKSIRVKDHVASIIENDCILCGTCTIVCPQHAKEDISDVPAVLQMINAGKQVIATVAPSFAAYFNISFNSFRLILKELGFADGFETAEGAFAVKSEFERLTAEKGSTWISSCCPSVNSYITKYKPEALKYLAPVLTPMQAHAKILKNRYPEAEIVFIGPCLAKKGETAEDKSNVSAVLLFEELEDWIEHEQIELPCGIEDNCDDAKLSRLFPEKGGVLKTMAKRPELNYLSVDGFQNVAQTLDDIVDGKLDNCFVEMNFCSGGCIGGPSFQRKKLGTAVSELRVRKAAGTAEHSQDFNVDDVPNIMTEFKSKRVFHLKPGDDQIEAVLRQMDKYSPEDELNCGMCGYSTCREKAEAVLRGKAEKSMCLPYIRKKAESYAGKVIDSMPSAVLSVDMSLKIQQINPAACAIFGMEPHNLIGEPVRSILDENAFIEALASGEEYMKFNTYLPDYDVYLDETISPDKKAELIICVLKDVTEEKISKRKALQKKQHAAMIADKIIDDQLRMVHEIASLLGETAAETKIAISDLKNTVVMDNEDR